MCWEACIESLRRLAVSKRSHFLRTIKSQRASIQYIAIRLLEWLSNQRGCLIKGSAESEYPSCAAPSNYADTFFHIFSSPHDCIHAPHALLKVCSCSSLKPSQCIIIGYSHCWVLHLFWLVAALLMINKLSIRAPQLVLRCIHLMFMPFFAQPDRKINIEENIGWAT